MNAQPRTRITNGEGSSRGMSRRIRSRKMNSPRSASAKKLSSEDPCNKRVLVSVSKQP